MNQVEDQIKDMTDAQVKNVLRLHLTKPEFKRYFRYMEELFKTPGDSEDQQIRNWFNMQTAETLEDYRQLNAKAVVLLSKFLLVTNI